MAAFPSIQFASVRSDFWGPDLDNTSFSSDDNVPFSLFSKSDRIGKVTDWIFQDPKFVSNNKNWNSRYQQAASNEFAYVHQEDNDDSFQKVESTKQTKTISSASSAASKFDASQQQQQSTGGFINAGGSRRNQTQKRAAQKSYQPRRNKDPTAEHKRNKELGVNVQSEWELVKSFEFSALAKLSTAQVSEPEDLVTCGRVEYYDASYDNVTALKSRPLEAINRAIPAHVTASEDPIIRQFSLEGDANVFATDEVLSLLMSCPRSILPWDIIIHRVGSKLFLDRREDEYFDLVTVNETCADLPHEEKESINATIPLMKEATHINNTFAQQVLLRGKKKKQFDRTSPFHLNGEQPSIAYKYRKWNIGEDIKLVARCEFDGVRTKNGKEETLLIKALNEYDPKLFGMEWRQKLETQRGGVLMTELKNNANKLSRWTAQALMAGVDNILLGFVSRSQVNDNSSHTVLGAHFHKPSEFVSMVHVNVNGLWGTLRGIITSLLEQPEGKYILLKDTSQAAAHLYKIPADAEFTVGTQE